MRFHTLILEGKHETENDEIHASVYTKKDYLWRKYIKNQIPLRNRSFYLCRMLEEELKGVSIDGSGKITVCAHQAHYHPGNEKYICDHTFNISIYYLEQEEITALEEADKDTEPRIMWEILRNALLDIAQQNHCVNEVLEKIKRAFAHIADSHFVREERIAKLTKHAKHTGLTAQVYRILSAEVGEEWYVKITDCKGYIYCQSAIGEGTHYVDRLGSRLYARSEWHENTFMIFERFGKAVFSISVPF